MGERCDRTVTLHGEAGEIETACRFAAGHDGPCESIIDMAPVSLEDLRRAECFARERGWL